MKQTNAYQLNLIEVDDPFLVAPINENTQALEDALISHGVNGTTHSDIRAKISGHTGNRSNPHGITAEQIGAAAESHSHNASNITAGTLAIARGGTGAATAAAACAKLGAHSIATRGSAAVPDGSDLDTYLTPGDYYVAAASNAATMINTPTKNSGYKLIVEQGYGGPSHLMQVAITSGPTCYIRNRINGIWYDWRQFLDSTTVETTPTSSSGKIITSGGVYTALTQRDAALDQTNSLVEQQGAVLTQKYGPDNAGWVTGSYAGSGSTETPQEIALGFRPAAVFIVGYNSSGTMNLAAYGYAIRSGDIVAAISTNTSYLGNTIGLVSNELTITENGFSVVLDRTTDDRSLNNSSLTYLYLALK